MVNIIIVAHAEIAISFVQCAEHVLARRIDNLHIMAVKKTQDIKQTTWQIQKVIDNLVLKGEVLLLTDLFGATPSNIAGRLLIPGKVEMITGLNLAMLIRAVMYADRGIKICIEKAIDGGKNGIIHLDGDKT